MENKQKFIAQIMTSKIPRPCGGRCGRNGAELFRDQGAGHRNPLIIEKCNLDMEVAKLNMLKASYLNQVYALEELVLRNVPEEITGLPERIAGYEKDVAGSRPPES